MSNTAHCLQRLSYDIEAYLVCCEVLHRCCAEIVCAGNLPGAPTPSLKQSHTRQQAALAKKLVKAPEVTGVWPRSSHSCPPSPLPLPLPRRRIIDEGEPRILARKKGRAWIRDRQKPFLRFGVLCSYPPSSYKNGPYMIRYKSLPNGSLGGRYDPITSIRFSGAAQGIHIVGYDSCFNCIGTLMTVTVGPERVCKFINGLDPPWTAPVWCEGEGGGGGHEGERSERRDGEKKVADGQGRRKGKTD
eukprot:1142739-Rhodomonas_salina.1